MRHTQKVAKEKDGARHKGLKRPGDGLLGLLLPRIVLHLFVMIPKL